MPEFLRNSGRNNKGFSFILIFLILIDLVILFNIPVLRQVLGLILIAILPGSLIIILLKLDKLGTAEKIVLMIGLSAAFLMFFGWMLSQISLQLGYARPLDTYTLVLSLSGVLVLLAIGAYLRNGDAFSTLSFHIELNTQGKLCLLLPMAFPLISILGTQYLYSSNNNIILLTLLFLIPISIIVIGLLSGKISQDVYPLALIMTSSALLIMFCLRSEHIIGHDVHTEYYLFHMTLVNSHWSILEGSWGTTDVANLDACLSISVLPTIFQSVLHLNGEEYLFKGVYTLICTFTPLGIYVISKKYIGELYAFLVALFFISQPVFLAAPGSARTNIAVFFFVLCIMVLFHNEITGVRQKGLYIIFMVATIVSHYTTSYIFLFLLLTTSLLGLLFRKYCPSRSISLTGITFFVIMAFLWYNLLIYTPFESGVQFISSMIRGLKIFWAEQARGEEVSMIMGQGLESPLKWIKWFLSWLVIALAAIGVVGTIIRRKAMVFAPQYSNSSPWFLRRRFEIEYLLLVIMGFVLLAAAVILPFASRHYDPERLYFQVFALLSVFVFVGTIILSKYLRINSLLFIFILLIPYFLFITGAMEQVLGYHVKYILDPEAPAASYELTYDQESQAAPWLKEHMDENSTIYTSLPGERKLISQGKIAPVLIDYREFFGGREIKGYVYLNYNNVVNGKVYFSGQLHDMSEYSNVISGKNRLYNNGGSEIYK